MKSLLLFFFLCSCSFVNAQNDTITVYFDLDSYKLSKEEEDKLFIFKTYSHISGPYVVEAHTDSSGSAAYNNRLAQKRLEFVLKQINLSEVSTNVIGEKQSSTAANYNSSKYRKVDIIFDKSGFLTMPEDLNPTVPNYVPVPVIPEELTLESGAEEFVNSEDSTLSIDLSIHFFPGSASPLPESYLELDRLVKFLQENKNLDAFLHGHVCCSDNLDISERRAKFVFNYLVKNGIQSNRLQMKGHSNWEPKVEPEITEKDRIANRRVIVVFTKK